MTERGRRRINVSRDRFEIGPSALTWTPEGLTIEVRETCAPIPYPLRGRIDVRFDAVTGLVFDLDEAGRHRWRPLAPSARVELEFDQPALSWNGRAYLDANDGDTPLEEGFAFWDWARAELEDAGTAVVYNTSPRAEAQRSMALRFRSDGGCEDIAVPAPAPLPKTAIWRIPRPARADAAPRVLRTFEDTPFYSRSMVELPLLGDRRRAMHESFSGDRLRSPMVKSLLPFRMPRLAN